jgi:hypothetical protein
MIYINHEKKTIFIHIPKTGGSYIGPTLVKYYGFTCYLSLIHKRRPDHDIVCKTNEYYKVITNNLEYDNSFFNKVLGILSYCKTSIYLNEKMNMNEEKWNTYIKFCFIRNPYDKLLSGWRHFKILFNRNISLYEYLNYYSNKNNVSDIEYGHVFMSQKTQIQDNNGNCGVDIIGRFENLEEDFRFILTKIGFSCINHKEKKVNVSNISNTDIIRLEVREIKLINKIFKEDFDTFHYKQI